MRLSLKELRERRERSSIEGEDRRRSGFPVEVLLSATGPIEQPVGLARALTGFGLDLSTAHAVLNRVTAGETVAVTLVLTQGGETPLDLCRFGVSLGQSLEASGSPVVQFVLGQEVHAPFENWRRSQPAQPPANEALALIVRAYLVEHGLMETDQPQQVIRVLQSE